MSEIGMSSELLQRLAGSLLHFVWQGALLALLAAIALRLLARRSAESRYTVGVITLGLMLAAPCVTFIFYAETGSATLRILQFLRASAASVPPADSGSIARWTAWIVAAWAAGATACWIRLLTGWFLSRHIIRLAKETVPSTLVNLMKRAQAALPSGRPVRLLIGRNVDMPMTFGWLRPLILLPATVVTGLDEDQLLAVLAHELAHIRRHDFMVNAVQRAVECVLFYHPAVWWISGRVRVERERCCDDLAVRVCGDALLYAQALTMMERARSTGAELTLAVTGGSVTDRVRRILGSQTRRRDWQSAVPALLFVAILVGAGTWQPTLAGQSDIQRPPARPEAAQDLKRVVGAPAAGATAREPFDDIVQVGEDPKTTLNAVFSIATAQGGSASGRQSGTKAAGSMEGLPHGSVAETITGRWQASGKLQNAPWTFELRVDGDRLTGTVQQGLEPFGPMPLEGQIQGSTLTFSFMSPDRERRITLTGTLGNGEITFSNQTEKLRLRQTPVKGIFGQNIPARFTTQRVRPGVATRPPVPERFDSRRGGPLDAGRVVVTTTGGVQPTFMLAFSRVGNVKLENSFMRVEINTTEETMIVRMLEGEYRVTVSGLPPGYTLKSLKANGKDMLKGTLKLSLTDTITVAVALDFSTPLNLPNVSGHITRLNTAPVKPNTVILTPNYEAAGRSQEPSGVPIRTRIASDGKFEFRGVAPGVYTVSLDPGNPSFEMGLGVDTKDVDHLEIPATLPGFTISGRLPAPAEMARQGVIAETDTVYLTLFDSKRDQIRQWPKGFALLPSIGRSDVSYIDVPSVRYPGQGNEFSTPVGTDGGFTFRNVPPGTYTIMLWKIPAGHMSVPPLVSNIETVTVVDRDVTGVEATPTELQR